MPSFMKNIGAIFRCGVQYREEHFADSGLNGYQSGYVLAICREPGLTQEQLSRRLHVNKSSVTRQLGLLEENGYLLRSQSEADKRAILVYPTPKAQAALPFVREVLRSWSDFLTQDFTPEELETLTLLLERVAQRAEGYFHRDGEEEGE